MVMLLTMVDALPALADTWLPARSRIIASRFGGAGLRIVPRPGGKSHATVFTLDENGKDKVIWDRTLVNVPDRVYISDDGKHVVTIDTYMYRGGAHSLVVYDDQGNVLADYSLEDILQSAEIELLVPATTSSRHWASIAAFEITFDDAHFRITIRPPEEPGNFYDEWTAKSLRSATVKTTVNREQREQLAQKLQELTSKPGWSNGQRVITVDLISGKLEQPKDMP